MTNHRMQAVEWLEELGFIVTLSAPAEDAEHAALLSRLARLLAEQRDQLKVRINAFRSDRAA